MTQKELLYLEDAIGHENSIISLLNTSLENIEDENLVSFIENEIDRHQTEKEDLINLLEEKANEW